MWTPFLLVEATKKAIECVIIVQCHMLLLHIIRTSNCIVALAYRQYSLELDGLIMVLLWFAYDKLVLYYNKIIIHAYNVMIMSSMYIIGFYKWWMNEYVSKVIENQRPKSKCLIYWLKACIMHCCTNFVQTNKIFCAKRYATHFEYVCLG